MESLIADIRFGARMLFKRPAFAAVAIITMALGIGANTAIFTVVNALLLRPPAYVEPNRLMTLWISGPNMDREEASLPDFVDWREQGTSFSSMSGAVLSSVNVTGSADPERVIGARTTANFFDTFGVSPSVGRGFTAADDTPNAEKVVLISDAYWQRRFAGSPDAIGRRLELNGGSYTIVGVLPATFKYPEPVRVDVYTPLAMEVDPAKRRSDFLSVFARLGPGATAEGARTEMSAIAGRLAQLYPDSNTGITTKVIPLPELLVEKSRAALYILLGAVAFVLLIACANVANLLLARSAGRRREIAIRAALGAGRWRIARQMLTESVLLSAIGGAIGLVIAPWATSLLVLAVPGQIDHLVDVSIDLRVIGFAAGLAMLTGMLFGLAPAFQISRVGAGEALKEGGRGFAGDAKRGLRELLVASQVGLALALLVGVGLTLRSFQKLKDVDLGFDPSQSLTARVSLPKARYADDASIVRFYDDVRARASAIPGVTATGAINALPILGGGPFLSFGEENAPEPASGTEPDANVRVVDAGYLDAVRIPLVAGRKLLESDRPGSPNVIVINQTMARKYWSGQDPIGRRIAFDGSDAGPNWREIVGIVGDVRHEGPDTPEVPAAYIPYPQRASTSLALVLRSGADPTGTANALRAAIHEVDPQLPVYSIQTMDAALGDALAPRRYSTMLLGVFGAIAVVLAAVGIYGVMSYLVTQRTREIGIRMALGAERNSVVALVLKQGLGMALAGVAVGCLGALGVSRLIAAQLYGVEPGDPISFAGATVLLVSIALLACLVPARRATKVDPMVALHDE